MSAGKCVGTYVVRAVSTGSPYLLRVRITRKSANTCYGSDAFSVTFTTVDFKTMRAVDGTSESFFDKYDVFKPTDLTTESIVSSLAR